MTVGILYASGKNLGTGRKTDSILLEETCRSNDGISGGTGAGKTDFCDSADMELIPDMEIYREVFFILRNETLNGRHVCELLEDMCKTEEMIPDMERAEQIFSYRDYPYMKKRWEKFCRHSAIAGTETLKWEEEMECFHHFLGDMWEAVCRDEVFFGDWMPELARFLG